MYGKFAVNTTFSPSTVSLVNVIKKAYYECIFGGGRIIYFLGGWPTDYHKVSISKDNVNAQKRTK